MSSLVLIAPVVIPASALSGGALLTAATVSVLAPLSIGILLRGIVSDAIKVKEKQRLPFVNKLECEINKVLDSLKERFSHVCFSENDLAELNKDWEKIQILNGK